MVDERYKHLVCGIIEYAILDYEYSVKRIAFLEKKKAKIIESGGQFRPIRKGEPVREYNRAKKRYTAEYIDSQIADKRMLFNDAKEFLLSPWLEEISNLDGKELIEKINKKLEKEGYTEWD